MSERHPDALLATTMARNQKQPDNFLDIFQAKAWLGKNIFEE